MTFIFYSLNATILAISVYLFKAKRCANSDPFAAVVPFIAFYFLNYSVRSIDLLFSDRPDYTGVLAKSLSALIPIITMAALGLCAFAIGYRLIKRNIGNNQIYRAISFDVSFYRLKAIHNVLIIFATISIAALLYKAGVGPVEYVSNLNYYRLNVNNDVAYLKFIINLCGLTGILLYTVCKQQIRRVPLLLLALPFIINFLFAHRHFAVYYIFSLITVHHYLVNRLSAKKVFGYAFAAFVANGIFAAWRDFKYVFPDRELSLDLVLSAYSDSGSLIDVILYHTYFAGFHGVDSVYKVVSAVDEGAGFHYGLRFLLEPIVGAIPYSVWRDKPLPLNTAINNLINREPLDYYDPSGPAGGIVGTVIGDLYWAGGILAIVVGMLVIGSMFAYVQRLTETRSAFPIFLYSAYYPVLFMFVSTIGSAIIRLVFFTVFVALLSLFIRQRKVKKAGSRIQMVVSNGH